LRAADDAAFGTLRGKPAALVTFLEGVWPRRVFPDHCRALGAALAAMHEAGRDFAGRRANDLSLASWRALNGRIGADADTVQPGLAAEIAGELDMLDAHWPRGLPEGVVHADLFPDNVFFDGGAITGIIDFYFSCNDFFAYDLAVCLNAWCFEPDGAFNVTKARHLLAAYRRVRPLSADEVAALPLLCRGSALRFLLTRLYDWLHTPDGALVRPKDPLEYLYKVRFHRGIAGPGEYGLD
jgi:homoserine kinase type II